VRTAVLLCLVAFPLFGRHCSRDAGERPGAPAVSASVAAPAPKHEGPLRIELLEAGATPATYVLRGGPRGREKLVFLHGMCGHGLGYAQSFQNSAARRGTLIAPQADIPCDGGPYARWSKDVAALDARITAAFRALGHPEPITDVIVIGYSQGATRAETLARTFPDRYTRLVLMGGPYQANPQGLQHLRAAVALAGARDRQDLMQGSARVLKAAKIPATFFLIPEATHGSMGPHPERTMDEVFGWLAEHQRSLEPIPSAPEPASSR
jgi:pimeloyl-ACP methyl ester carboxylesterase